MAKRPVLTTMHPDDAPKVTAIALELQQEVEAAGQRAQTRALGRKLRQTLQRRWSDGELWAMRASLSLQDDGAAKFMANVMKQSRLETSSLVLEDDLPAYYGIAFRDSAGQQGYQYAFIPGMSLADILKARRMVLRQRDRSNRVLAQFDVMIAAYRRFPDAVNVGEACRLAGIRLDLLQEDAQ